MAIHKPYDRHIICPPHAKLADVDSLLLQEGQIAIYDLDGEQTKDGLKALKDLKGYRKDEQRFQIRIGRNEMVNDRVSDDKSFSTPTFAIDEIIEVYASAPKSKEIKVDENEVMTLKEVKVGDTVTVKKLNGQGATKRRIMDMGITKGVEVFVRKVAPLGDPIEVTVRGYELSLRKADAAMIDVD